MRRTTPNRESRDPQPQNRLNFVEPGEPGFEPETIARYRVALVREEATPYESPEHCGDPAAAARFLHTILSSWDREVMGALFLDTRNRAIGHQLAYIGTLTRAAVEPRGILTAALLSNAAGILLFHNHPSGDPSPSAEDLAFTRRMAEAGEVVGVRVVDHIIIGEAPAFVSLRQRGAFWVGRKGGYPHPVPGPARGRRDEPVIMRVVSWVSRIVVFVLLLVLFPGVGEGIDNAGRLAGCEPTAHACGTPDRREPAGADGCCGTLQLCSCCVQAVGVLAVAARLGGGPDCAWALGTAAARPLEVDPQRAKRPPRA